VYEAGWTPGPVWTGAENLACTGIRSPDRPTLSESLYRLLYSGPLYIYIYIYIYVEIQYIFRKFHVSDINESFLVAIHPETIPNKTRAESQRNGRKGIRVDVLYTTMLHQSCTLCSSVTIHYVNTVKVRDVRVIPTSYIISSAMLLFLLSAANYKGQRWGGGGSAMA